jgi:hypothetical protein
MTPNDIDVLLHYNCTPGPHERLHAPAVQDAIADFLFHGMLERSADGEPDTYQITARGRAHVSQLCALEYPEPGWLGRDGKVINDYMTGKP